MLAVIGIILTLFAMILRLVHTHGDIQWWLIAIAVVLIGVDVVTTRGPAWYRLGPYR